MSDLALTLRNDDPVLDRFPEISRVPQNADDIFFFALEREIESGVQSVDNMIKRAMKRGPERELTRIDLMRIYARQYKPKTVLNRKKVEEAEARLINIILSCY